MAETPLANGTSFLAAVEKLVGTASKSPLGIIALMITAVSILGYFFFHSSAEHTKYFVFGAYVGVIIFTGVLLITVETMKHEAKLSPWERMFKRLVATIVGFVIVAVVGFVLYCVVYMAAVTAAQPGYEAQAGTPAQSAALMPTSAPVQFTIKDTLGPGEIDERLQSSIFSDNSQDDNTGVQTVDLSVSQASPNDIKTLSLPSAGNYRYRVQCIWRMNTANGPLPCSYEGEGSIVIKPGAVYETVFDKDKIILVER